MTVSATPPFEFALDHVRTDGWFRAMARDTENFTAVCEVIGERFVAFSIILGLRITAITVDPRWPDTSLIEFAAADATATQQLPLAEFRRRVASAILRIEVPQTLPTTLDQDNVRLLLGMPFVLLADLYEITLLQLRIQKKEAILTFSFRGDTQEVTVSDFHDALKQRVRSELDVSRKRLLTWIASLDVDLIESIEAALAAEDHAQVVSMAGSWPVQIAALSRSSDVHLLTDSTRRLLGRGLYALSMSHLATDNDKWSEEVLRLGLQCTDQGTLTPSLFEGLGRIFVARKRFGEALGYLRRAYALGAPRQKVLPPLAQAFFERGRYVAARICLDEALLAGAPEMPLNALREALDAKLGRAYAAFRARVPLTSPTAATLMPPPPSSSTDEEDSLEAFWDTIDDSS